MFREMFLFAVNTAFLFQLLLQTSNGKDNSPCAPSSCGNILNISYPFRLDTDPENCGNPRYTLSCEANFTVLFLYTGKYYVQAINYVNFTIRVVDAGVHDHDDCSSIPRFPLTQGNFSLEDTYTLYKSKRTTSLDWDAKLSKTITFINCVQPVNPTYLNSSLYLETDPCTVGGGENSYVNIGGMEGKDLMSMCSIEMVALLPGKDYNNMSYVEIQRELAYGFELSWHFIYCGGCRGCYFDETDKVQCISGYFRRVCYLNFGIQCTYIFDSSKTGAFFFRIKESFLTVLVLLGILHCITKTLCGTPFVIAFFIYKWRRRHQSGYDTVEEFLQSQNNLMPIRYSYKDIRRMTRGFEDKLGQGGFGSVYKGTLRSGHLAAIKMLSKSKTNGQDFISEVATLGRIHHTNVVQLIGFCVDGTKHALVYDFMPNGSLDKYLHSHEGSISLSWDRLYEISVGVARGIEYLHQGCEMQILHFDIKPHNILLDENFTPKISDFGLAKLYATKDSIKSLTEARGTIGYMAPELFYRNIGRVSYKADIYSFGMLLLEMAGKRKNLNALAEHSSETYFPFWVYDEVSEGKVVVIGDDSEESNKIAKKMVMVGLLCIQMKPDNRPPMNKVLEMLEGDVEALQLPPRPALIREEPQIKYGEESLAMSTDFAESSSLMENTF